MILSLCPQVCKGTCYLVVMLSPLKFNVKVLYLCLCHVLEKGRIGTWRQMNEDMKQMSKGYETARTKGTFKTRRQTKQIYFYNKTYIDTLKNIRVCV